MGKVINAQAVELLQEIDCIDRSTLELKKDLQHKGCPFCEVDDGGYIENYQTRRALFFKYKKCNRCSLIYPYPRPNQKMQEDTFRSDEFSQVTEEGHDMDKARLVKDREVPVFVKPLRNAWRSTPLIYSYQEFTKYAKKGDKVLDIGAGVGKLAKKLKQKGCIVEAVELNPYRAKCLREELGLKIYEGRFEDVAIADASYDVVVLSQVMMHLFSLKANMKKLHLVLKPGGLVIASLNNFDSVVQRTVRSPYPGEGLTPFTMPSCFTEESARRIFSLAGFKVEEIRYRPDSLFDYFFIGGYPGGIATRMLLKGMDQILKIIQIVTKTSNYFAIIAKKI